MNTLNMSEAELDEYRERVAILEFEAGYSRAEAEAIVKSWVLRARALKKSNSAPKTAPSVERSDGK